MFLVFISSFVCKIHFKGHSTSFNPSAKVVWADLFFALALRVEPLKIQLGLHCQRLVPLLCSASSPPTPAPALPPFPKPQYNVKGWLWSFR